VQGDLEHEPVDLGLGARLFGSAVLKPAEGEVRAALGWRVADMAAARAAKRATVVVKTFFILNVVQGIAWKS